MKITGVIPEEEVCHITKETDLDKAIGAFQRAYPNAEVMTIDGKAVIGDCESCGLPILEGQKHFRDDDGIIWHKTCD